MYENFQYIGTCEHLITWTGWALALQIGISALKQVVIYSYKVLIWSSITLNIKIYCFVSICVYLYILYIFVKACIRYNSKHSDFLNSYTGLKQGDPSYPLLFMLFINDLVDNINANLENIFELDELMLFIILYADDAVVFARSKESLQSLLNDIELYCGTWGLKINTRKTKVMIFEKGRHTSCDLFLNNVKLEVVQSFKYLGVHFFKNGNWFRTQKRLANHASRALHNLFALFRHVWTMQTVWY